MAFFASIQKRFVAEPRIEETEQNSLLEQASRLRTYIEDKTATSITLQVETEKAPLGNMCDKQDPLLAQWPRSQSIFARSPNGF